MARKETVSETALKFSCGCCQVSGSVTFPSSALPLPISLCHCGSCRHSTGQLCTSVASLPEKSVSLFVSGKLKEYESCLHMTRFFCEHCGASIYGGNSAQDIAIIYTGVLEDPKGLIKLQNHEHVADTKDGGLSIWLPNVPIWEDQPRKSQPKPLTSRTEQNYSMVGKTDYSLSLQCHCSCGGVGFCITRPDQHSADFSCPWPDLIVPYHSTSPLNTEDAKWWLCQKNTKYLAGTCACKSCRLISGSDIQAWAFVPRSNIFQLDGKSLDFTMGTLKQYSSSEGVYREFCGTCGATVFWHCDERPDLIDVSVGLLNADCGARVESWLSWWTERVSFEEDANNKEMISSLSIGIKNWGERNDVTD